MTLILRYMQTDDIHQVSAIDRVSFDPAWPPNSYVFEINQSTVSHMVILELDNDHIAPPSENQGLRRFLKSFRGNSNGATGRKIVGYGGLWKIADEAHISTIATHPDYRGQGYGEILVAGMYRKSLALDADYVVLEVRVSNVVAQRLYRKYGFIEYGIKENYYRSDNEDAYDMRVEFDEEKTLAFYDLYDALMQKQPFIDDYSDTPHPRLG